MKPNKKEDNDPHLKLERATPTEKVWWKHALTAGVIAALGFLLVSNIPPEYLLTRISLVIGFAVFVLVMTKNPVNRYMNGFYIVLLMAISTNGIPFIGEFLLKKNNMEIMFAPSTPDFKTNLIMGVICIVLLVLDYKEKKHVRQDSAPAEINPNVTYKDNATHKGDNHF